mgnify:CR=1 FL=1
MKNEKPLSIQLYEKYSKSFDKCTDQEIIKAQEKMKSTLEDWIPKILAAQEPDGYIQTAFTLSGNQRWTRRSCQRRNNSE